MFQYTPQIITLTARSILCYGENVMQVIFPVKQLHAAQKVLLIQLSSAVSEQVSFH